MRKMFVAAFAAAVLSGFSSGAQAHIWYSTSCCSGNDCRPAAPGEIVFEGGQYYWYPPGGGPAEVVDPGVIRDRPTNADVDDMFHVCEGRDGNGSPFLRCLYPPDGGV